MAWQQLHECPYVLQGSPAGSLSLCNQPTVFCGSSLQNKTTAENHRPLLCQAVVPLSLRCPDSHGSAGFRRTDSSWETHGSSDFRSNCISTMRFFPSESLPTSQPLLLTASFCLHNVSEFPQARPGSLIREKLCCSAQGICLTHQQCDTRTGVRLSGERVNLSVLRDLFLNAPRLGG